jgi:hypothetical protein
MTNDAEKKREKEKNKKCIYFTFIFNYFAVRFYAHITSILTEAISVTFEEVKYS